ncbi:MAG TPA: isopentenyl-diphosphate delta-isomerase [Flavilitoribacter sp.]|nr:isopentenyl-diphosphate delta-isomerase [Flavilitoribacter sp.]
MQDLKKDMDKLQQSGDDPTSAERKQDHIELAFRSRVERPELDTRFSYEPILSGHPAAGVIPPSLIGGKTLKAPLWVSSMTGGTAMAGTINRNLARACSDFGLGMGLGSCRALLHSDDTLGDFAVRPVIGPDQPLYANLGIAQVEELISSDSLGKITRLIDKLEADGLIIHVNPLQEWLQPEGDRIQKPPLESIRSVLEYLGDMPVIVKEVGQGMGKESLRALLQLPLAAVDFAANGGTNFARLELMRSTEEMQEIYGPLALVGHSAEEMVDLTNELALELGERLACRRVIISGGITNFLDGYYLVQKSSLTAIYGQASGFLKHARGDYQDLFRYTESVVKGLEMAYAFLSVKK